MSLTIKGMEMPQKIEPGLVIEFADGIDGKRYARLYHHLYGGLTDWLAAIPVPPHGDLIDRGALKEAFCGNCFADEKPMECSEPCMDMKIILDAPTIIEADDTVRKAHDDYSKRPGHWEFICSNCGADAQCVEGGSLDGAKFKYCPNCGAIIEAEEGE